VTVEAATGWRWMGSDQPRLLMGGHSHRYALLAALNLAEQPIPAAVLNHPELRYPSTDEYWRILVDSSPDLPLAIAWGGNEMNVRFLFDHEVPFRVTGVLADDAARQVVPVEMVSAFASSSLDGLRMLLDRLDGRQTIVIGGPPPKRRERFQAWLQGEVYFKQQLDKFGWTPETAPVAPLELRMRLWQIHRETLQELVTAHGSTLLDIPPQAVDDDGTLRAEFGANDITHAGPAYGRLIWQMLFDHFGLEFPA
jgi:hypothetical protein